MTTKACYFIMARMKTLFISDLHLSPARPHINQLFFDFLKTEALNAHALYILGDFFDFWIGDDVMDDFANQIAKAIHDLVATGVSVFLMPGNRDFLYRKVFAQKSGAILIKDPTCIDLYGTRTLLVHGDGLCTHDKPYQIFRAIVRNPVINGLFLQLPLSLRTKIATYLRQKSQIENKKKKTYVMDVSQPCIEKLMQHHGALRLIHGHTHIPTTEHFMLNEHHAHRVVLGSWEESGHVWICDEDESIGRHKEIH